MVAGRRRRRGLFRAGQRSVAGPQVWDRVNATRSMIRSFSIFFLSLPFLFGLLRAATTSNDFRYLWVAAAALFGAGTVTAAAGGRMRQPRVALAVSVASFVVATLFATGAGVMQGTHFGPGLLVVASSFALCCAVGCTLFAITRR